MREIRVGAAQFENRDNDKAYNLGRMRELTRRAVEQGAEIVSFHEGCIPAFTWVQPLGYNEMAAVAEPAPDGPSIREMIRIAAEFKTVVMAGLVERDQGGKLYNTYAIVGPDGYIAKYRKLHAFINPNETASDRYQVIDLLGCKIGFLICYDNN